MLSEQHAGDASSGSPGARPPDILLARDHPELLQRIPAIVYIADPGPCGRWYYVSPQIETILGFSAEEWRAEPDLWSRRLHPEDRERVLESEADHAAGRG
jgi:PAS domain-containing protein